MKRRSGAAVLAALGVCLMATPVAGAATRHATVLSVNRSAHTLRVVGANHQAKTFRVKGRMTRTVKTGAKVAFRVRGRFASHVRVVGASPKVTVKGRVTRAHRIRLADGKALKVGNVTVTLVGFDAGQQVEVTVAITDGGDVNVIVKLDDDHGACTQQCPIEVEGHVTALSDTPGSESITVDSGEDGGTPYTFHVTAEQLATVQAGDEVEVSAHQTDGGWVADRIEVKGGGGDDGSSDGDTTPPPPPTTLNIVVKVLEINAGEGWFRVAGTDSGLDDTGGLRVYSGSCDLTAAGIVVGDIARVHATRTAPEHWECTAVEELAPPV
jgi:hypothetical protein